MALPASLSSLVRHRAHHACEYCHLPEAESDLAFPIDHIIARQHGGATIESNLALSCPFCNLHKGPNIAGIDPETGALTPLYHPRRDRWVQHFHWDGVVIAARTETGRATAAVLAMNDARQIAVRQEMLSAGWLRQADA